MDKLCHLKNNGGVIHSLICPHHPPVGAHVRVHSFFYRKVNTNKIHQTCQVGQQSKKPRRKLKLCLAALSTAASYVITISTSNTMWQPEGINYSVPSFTIFCLLLSIAVPSIITTIHFLLSFTVPSQLLVPPPSSSLPHSCSYQHVIADFLKFTLDLHAVITGHLLFLLVPLRLLLDAGDDAPGWTACPHLLAKTMQTRRSHIKKTASYCTWSTTKWEWI